MIQIRNRPSGTFRYERGPRHALNLRQLVGVPRLALLLVRVWESGFCWKIWIRFFYGCGGSVAVPFILYLVRFCSSKSCKNEGRVLMPWACRVWPCRPPALLQHRPGIRACGHHSARQVPRPTRLPRPIMVSYGTIMSPICVWKYGAADSSAQTRADTTFQCHQKRGRRGFQDGSICYQIDKYCMVLGTKRNIRRTVRRSARPESYRYTYSCVPWDFRVRTCARYVLALGL